MATERKQTIIGVAPPAPAPRPFRPIYFDWNESGLMHMHRPFDGCIGTLCVYGWSSQRIARVQGMAERLNAEGKL